jgi:hypothetical protein
MPKVGIMTEVSVEVYESVVVPAKGQKRFNRLVSQLLEAYYTSDKVRSVVDGEEALSNLEGLSNLQKQLQEASESVAYMGMVNETIQMGLDSAKEDIESEDYGKSKGVSSSKSDDLEDFKREVLEGQKSFMEDMRTLMSDFMAINSSNGISTREVKEEPVVVKEAPKVVEAPKVIETPMVAPVVEEVAPVVTPPVVEVPTAEPLPPLNDLDMDDLLEFEEEPETKPQELSGQDILNNLLGGGGNSFNFGGIQ